MTGGNDPLERNLERLIREGVPPASDAARARREFLARVEGASRNPGRMIAMAASLLAAAAILFSAFWPRVQTNTATPGRQDAPGTDPTAPRDGERPAPTPPPAPAPKVVAAPGPSSQPLVAKDDIVTLSFPLPGARTAINAPILLEGKAPYPEKTQLKTTVTRMIERYAAGRLLPIGSPVGGQPVYAEGHRFGVPAQWQGPGTYVVSIELGENAVLADALKKFPRKTSSFEFAAWRDDLVGQLGSKLLELDALAKECLDLESKYEKLALQESSWVKEWKNVDPRGADIVLTREAEQVVKDVGNLKARLEAADVRVLFPAAHGELFFTLQSLQGIWRNFAYEAGRFARAKSYHAAGGKIKTHRNEDFGFDVARKYLEEASPIAGREMALWIVKDLQRVQGLMRQDHRDALKTCGARPGLSSVADRLTRAKLEDLEGIEKDVRAGSP